MGYIWQQKAVKELGAFTVSKAGAGVMEDTGAIDTNHESRKEKIRGKAYEHHFHIIIASLKMQKKCGFMVAKKRNTKRRMTHCLAAAAFSVTMTSV
jgi:hypothetical protein